MKSKLETAKLSFATLLLALSILSVSVSGQTTVFTYQGSLKSGATAANGFFDFELTIFDAVTGGTAIATYAVNGVTVSNGVFTMALNGSPSIFDGGARFVEIKVKATGGGSFETLAPRQLLTSAPYSVKSLNATTATSVTGVVGIANGGTGSSTKNFVDLSTTQTDIAGDKTFTGAVSVSGGGVFNGNGSGLTNLNGANIVNNSISSTQLTADAQPAAGNLKLLGQLRWDLLKSQLEVPVGGFPTTMAFDGNNMWVVNLGGSALTKVRVSDGAVLGNFGSGQPAGAVFDGQNIWYTGISDNLVYKLRASDGAVLGSYNVVGTSPRGIAFDGANLWIACSGSNSLIRMRTSDGGVTAVLTVGNFPTVVAFDGANVWTGNNNSGTVTRVRTSDLATQTINVTGGGAGVRGLAFDGTNMWVTAASNLLQKIKASDGTIQATYSLALRPDGVAFDGRNIWVTTGTSNSVYKIRPSDGTILNTFPSGANSLGMAFDGNQIWVANADTNKVTRMLPAFPELN